MRGYPSERHPLGSEIQERSTPPNAIPWDPKYKSAAPLAKVIYDSMGWDTAYAYRIPCQTIKNKTAASEGNTVLAFDLDNYIGRAVSSKKDEVVITQKTEAEERDEANLLRIPVLLKAPETIVEALCWIDDIISKARDDENKSLLLTKAYEAERLRLPPALAELPEEPNRDVDELAYAYWLGYIYRCECLLHEESSRMVYGAFPEIIMRKEYEELMRSPLAGQDLIDSAMEICEILDRFLVEKIWPAKEKRQHQRQMKELERPNNTKEDNG